MSSSGLVCNGSSTRGRVILPNSAPFNNIFVFFGLSIHVRNLRVSHPTKQYVMAAPGMSITIEGGSLVFTTTVSSGGTCSVPLGGATEGEILLRCRDNQDGTMTFILSFTKRSGPFVGQASVTMANATINISGGAGLSIAARNDVNTENLAASIDDFRWANLNNQPRFTHDCYPDYGFVGNGNDSGPAGQNLTLENATFEQTPEVLQGLRVGNIFYLSGITPEPGNGIRIFRRMQGESYDYACPLVVNYSAGFESLTLPWAVEVGSSYDRFFYVARVFNLQTGATVLDSNEVYDDAPLAAVPTGFTRLTFDEFYPGPSTRENHLSQLIASDLYKAQGVLISAAPYGPFVSPGASAHTPFGWLYAATQPMGFVPSNPAEVGNPTGVLTLNFVVPGTTTPGRVGSVSFNVVTGGVSGSVQWTAAAFDKNGVLLQTIQGTNDVQVLFTRPGKDISRVIFTPPNAVGAGIDSLEFEIPIAA